MKFTKGYLRDSIKPGDKLHKLVQHAVPTINKGYKKGKS